jgi:hypothetical protein
LREELAKRVAQLRHRGMIDLEALPPPANKEGAIAEEDQQDHAWRKIFLLVTPTTMAP